MLDHYIQGSCERISPEAPVPVVDVKNDMYLLGGAGNVSNNLISFDAEVSIFGIIGNDKNATIIENLIQEKNITNHLIKINERKTTIKTRVIVGGHQLIRLDSEDKIFLNSIEEDVLINSLKANFNKCDLVIISDYAKGCLTKKVVNEIVKLAKQFNKLVLVDPKGTDFSKYEGVNIIKPNKKEASLASGISIHDHNSLVHACEIIASQTKCDIVIVTLSEDGVAIFQNGELTTLPTKAKEIFDVTGAGDTFLAALSFSLMNDETLYAACEFANYASAVVIGKSGSSVASFLEIDTLIKSEIN